MSLKEKILDKVEDFLKTIIIKYWYIDLTITIFAFLILYLIEKFRKNKV
ncbi:hypothetical protein [Acidianus bottle-shaped virus]|uniref:Uncharacterized protein ORF48a n=1 Tax=Acidianus bottle-shaped virus (isolate Italy/Pozzuoli) TaxID=654911 RepID=Y048A_ABVP|nr:hypothetical protein ABV_gp42 [Acidianus bottle-shaped virus]A4ZUC8.1 RecName: Full=Uncharacterized protein ORF48a [Acidianus bottle-shaped virus (isolate Pozzuoli)]ABP73432.1 hypothetical protein [Acidianus bottle-shaped virus]